MLFGCLRWRMILSQKSVNFSGPCASNPEAVPFKSSSLDTAEYPRQYVYVHVMVSNAAVFPR
jgi:hypothetical protein